jgi:hypothetical protein
MHLYYLLFVVYNALFNGIGTQIVCCLVIINRPLGVKPLIHQSELRTVVPFQEKSAFHFVVL